MKKQIVTVMMMVSSVLGSQAYAQTGVADNLTAQKIAQSDVPDNMLSLLTALRAYSIHNNAMDRGEKNVNLGDFRDCTNEDLIAGTCTQDLGVWMAAVIDVKLADNKYVQFTALNCENGLSVRDPNNYEIDLHRDLIFDVSGTYTVSNRNFESCTVKVQVLDK